MVGTFSNFGVGAYTPSEAAKLLHMSPAMLRRWLYGYSFKRGDSSERHQSPLWQAQYDFDEDEPILGFRDLIEARTVRMLRQIGLGMPTIRHCLATAREIAGDTHPFSTKKLKTDGNRLYMEIASIDGEKSVIDLKHRQHAFSKVIESTFLDLEFEDGVASRWWLNPKRQSLVVDPERSFGQPIAAISGIPTKRLAESVNAEGSARKVSRLFDVPLTVVNDAVKFEASLSKAA